MNGTGAHATKAKERHVATVGGVIELDPVEFSLELGSMLASAALTLALPLRALRRGVLQLPRDSVFLLFWAQAWLYVHAVPTLNAAFPHAIGAAGPLERAIQFQADDVFNYAQLQIASTFLFFAPMLWLYGRWVRRDSDATFRASISPLRLGGLGAAFSVFGAVYIRTANANGLLSPYAASVGRFLSLPRIDYFVIRVYQVSAVFLFLVIAIAFLRMTAGATQKLLVAALAAPGAACFATHVLCSGRTAAVFASALLLSAVASCGSLAGMTRKGVARGLAVVVPLLAYAMIVIPRVRIIVTYKDFELAEVAESMQPFGSAPRRFAVEKYYRGYGTRLDGLELMAVATPQLLRYGLDFGVMWLTPALAPVAPLFPDWERNLKSAGELDV
ncbi:MAG: hypothetical protein U0263_26680 [Polyangiaceae bacterium]